MKAPRLSPKRLLAAWLIALCGWNFPTVLAQEILIEELRDIDLGEVTPTAGSLEANITLCVAVTENTRYQILASGSGINGSFAMRSGPYSIPYTVQYTDSRKASGYRDLFAGLPLFGLRPRPNFKGACRRSNANLRVQVNSSDLQSAPGGTYSGTLMLTVSPE